MPNESRKNDEMELKRDLKQKLLEKDLRNGLLKNQFVLYYQPIIDGENKKTIALEALIRWEHPTYGLLFPNDFIPLAEESGMMKALGEWVLQEACEQYKVWQVAGLPAVRVNVNISASHFLQEGFIEQVKSIMEKTHVTPSCLELEITEIAKLKDIDQTLKIMQGLKEIGVRVALDDFGTGYNCLQLLLKMPVDAIKIDRSFVKDILTNTRMQNIVLSIIHLTEELGTEFVAEGVETEEIYHYLIANNCKKMQGYLFGKPMARGAIESYLMS